MARVLVTGGAGFIGSNLVRGAARARRRGARARQLLHRQPREPRRARRRDRRGRAAQLRARAQRRARHEVVYHLGALGSVPRSVQDPLTSSAVNVEGTLNVLLAARDEGIRRVVFSSSASVYGSSRQMPTTEDSPPDPISPYGVAKLAAERYCVSFSRVYESFESVVLRYFNVFGPRQSPFSQYAAAVPLFITKIAAGEAIDVYGDGEQSRDFTFVGNVVDATIRAGDAEGASGEIFNVAAGSPASVNSVAETIGGDRRQAGRRRELATRAPATSATPGPTCRSRSACSAMRRRSPSRTASGARSSPCSTLAARAGRARNAFQAGFCLPVDGLEAGLPARRVRLVAHEEPEHHVDARVLARDRIRLRQVLRLLRLRDAERLVGRIRLIAVLGDPEVLRPVVLRDRASAAR